MVLVAAFTNFVSNNAVAAVGPADARAAGASLVCRLRLQAQGGDSPVACDPENDRRQNERGNDR